MAEELHQSHPILNSLWSGCEARGEKIWKKLGSFPVPPPPFIFSEIHYMKVFLKYFLML